MKSGAILTLNAGSSSLKFALFAQGRRDVSGKVDRIGRGDAKLTIARPDEGASPPRAIDAPDHAACLDAVFEAIAPQNAPEDLRAAGHRIVHGGERYFEPARVDGAMLERLERIAPFDPEHLPAQIALLRALALRLPGLTQIACFDTAFHKDLPPAARLLAIPRRYARQGIRRFGFHGLSYAYLVEELERRAGREAARGRLVLAHLGNGASLAAVREGKSVDTTMAFTPGAGVPMSTRSGDIDPGLVAYLARTEGMSAEAFHRMTHAESGLLGLSETSGDVRDLLEREASGDSRAAEALAVFCWRVRAAVGGLAANLGGLDTLVFAGGIGENAPEIRRRICEGLGFLGVDLDADRNAAGRDLVSRDGAAAAVRVIQTDEESQIARSVGALLRAGSRQTV